MRYYDVFSEGGFHSAFMTTYAFGTLAFEDIPFPKLRGAGCRNIVVLADRALVNQALSDYGPPLFAGSSYHLIKASAPRAFHPKITLMLGELKGRLFVSSANLTALGLAGNKEQIASVEYSSESPETAGLFRRAIAYLQRYVPSDDQWFATSLGRAQRATPWLYADGSDTEFSGAGEASLNLLFDRPELTLLDQIRASVGNDPIERLVIVSPYWDEKLEGLVRLRSAFGDPPADLLIDAENGFPGSELARFSGVNLFDIGSSAGTRFLHAKLIVASGAGWDHVISGSMNCTFPALMGPASKGNAEAAIYKRVARGTALPLLGLDGYQEDKLAPQILEELEQHLETLSDPDLSRDGGTLTLQYGRLTWTSPVSTSVAPSVLRLQDKDGIQLAEVQLEDQASTAHLIPPEGSRPKYGRVIFVDESVSAPIVVTDLSVLAVSTLPPRMGKKKRLLDSLGEMIHEDLDLIEMLNRLEELEAEEQEGRDASAARAGRDEAQQPDRSFGVLPYDEFVLARTNAISDRSAFGLYHNSQSDKGVHVLSVCLNKMIGLVGSDLAGLEAMEIEAQNAVDLRTTESHSLEEGGSGKDAEANKVHERSVAVRNLATAKKFQEAVDAFTARCKALRDKQITTSEMVRVRALMQIILSYAQPISGVSSASQILPVYNKDGHDWPRLIGRLILLHFGTARALQYLTVEPDEAEQQRVLEYLALANWAAKAALKAVKSEKKALALLVPLERRINELATQTKVILSAITDDQIYFDEITEKLDERFAGHLGL